MVMDQVFTSYVNAGSMTVCMNLLFRNIDILWSLRKVLYCQNLFQTAVIPSYISLLTSFLDVNNFPKDLNSSSSRSYFFSTNILLRLVLLLFCTWSLPSFCSFLFYLFCHLCPVDSAAYLIGISSNRMVLSVNLRMLNLWRLWPIVIIHQNLVMVFCSFLFLFFFYTIWPHHK